MELAHTRETQDVLDHFGVDTEVGLDEERAKKDLVKYGLNGKATVTHQTYVCMWVCFCAYMYVYTYIPVHTYVRTCVCMCMQMCVVLFDFMNIYASGVACDTW